MWRLISFSNTAEYISLVEFTFESLQLKREIMKELKIKEGAENLLKLTKKDKREVERMIKQSNNKLDALNLDLQEVNNYLVITGDGSRASRRASMPQLGESHRGKIWEGNYITKVYLCVIVD